MRIRSDFVTNSSSASYVIDFQFKSDLDAAASFTIKTSDIGTSCVVSDTPGEFTAKRHAKELELHNPQERNGEIHFSLYGKPLSEMTDLEELIGEVLRLASGHLYDGDWLSAGGFMPGAVEALAKSCEKRGITRENLRIIGGKISVFPWGDSLYEVHQYLSQWGINVHEGKLKRTGAIYWQGLNTPGWDLSWRDTAWWPLLSE